MATVTFRNLSKEFPGPQGNPVRAVDNLNLQIRDGEFLVLVGPSGCGKTTALRMLAGLEEASSGEILIGDKTVNEVSPRDRNIAMVFQNYALYPHMSVYENMAFGLRLRMLPKWWQRFSQAQQTREINTEIDRRIRHAAELLDIAHLLDRRPKALSGGQRQRVALGRAIVREPQVFLMDEPLSNLDAKLRVQTRAELVKLHRRLGITTVYVTHDQVEAMTMGQRIAVMRGGVLQQIDTPLKLYHEPVNMFVAGFLGTPSMNFLEGELRMNGQTPTLNLDAFQVDLPEQHREKLAPYNGKNVVFGIRPEDIHDRNFVPASVTGTTAEARLTVDVIEPMGSVSTIFLTGARQTLVASIDANSQAQEGAPLDVVLDIERAHIFDKETEQTVV